MAPRMTGFAGILVANLVAALDAAALAVALPTIANELNATSIEAYWAGTAFVLSSAAFQPLFPAFSNAFGRRLMVVVALLLLIVGTILCGIAHDVSALLAGRTIQGVGGGGILAMTYTVMTDLFTLRRRSTAIAVNGLVWLTGTAVGPVMGGGFSSEASWRWIFWICLPLLAAALLLVVLFLQVDNEEHNKSYHRIHYWRNLDWIGAVLFVISLTTLLLPISWGGVMFAWNLWQTVLPLSIGGLGLMVWLFYEARVPVNPIMPLSIFSTRTTSIALSGTFMIGVIQFGLIFYLPLYYQIIKGYSATFSGVAILPVTLVSGLSTAFAGVVISKIGRYKTIILIGWAFLSLGCGLMHLLDLDTSIPGWLFLTATCGLGGGVLFTALAIAAQAHVDQEHLALAAALTPFIRAIGQAIGITAGNSILQNQLQHYLEDSSFPELSANAHLIAQNLASPTILSQFAYQQSDLLSAYTRALQDFWWFLLAAALFSGVLSLAIKDVSLDRANFTSGDDMEAAAIKGSEISTGDTKNSVMVTVARSSDMGSRSSDVTNYSIPSIVLSDGEIGGCDKIIMVGVHCEGAGLELQELRIMVPAHVV